MEMQDVALCESVVQVLEGNVELVTCEVVDTVVGWDGRNPVVDNDLGVDWVPWGQGRKASDGVGTICLAKAWSGLELFWILYHASRGSMMEIKWADNKPRYCLIRKLHAR